MSNLSSYCGLVDAKIRAFDKNVPVQISQFYLKLYSEFNKSDKRVLNSDEQFVKMFFALAKYFLAFLSFEFLLQNMGFN